MRTPNKQNPGEPIPAHAPCSHRHTHLPSATRLSAPLASVFKPEQICEACPHPNQTREAPIRPTPPPDTTTDDHRAIPHTERLARATLYAGVGVAIYFVLRPIRGVLISLLISLLLAYVLDPLVDRLEARRVPRTAAIGLLVAGALLFLATVAVLLAPPILDEARQWAERIESLMRNQGGWLEKLEQWLQSLGVDAGPLQQHLRDAAPSVLQWLGQFAKTLAVQTAEVMSSVLNIVTIPLFAFYFLRDFDRMTSWTTQHIPLRWRATVAERSARVHDLVGSWLRGQIQVAGALALLYAAGLTAIGLPLGMAVGLLAGLLGIVPYLGFAVGFGVATLLALVHWTGWGLLLGVAAVFTVGQLLEGYVLTPRWVGEKVGLSPVATLIALLLGGDLFGLIGILLAVPVAGILRMAVAEWLDAYRNSDFFERDPAE